jgi:hypothetical protein
MVASGVIEMRRLWATGLYSKARLAGMFHVTEGCVRLIVTDKIWRHLLPAGAPSHTAPVKGAMR